MKAIRVHQFGGPDVLRLEEVTDLKPAANEILVRVHAAGVNPVETYIRSGAYASLPPLPYTPGKDAAGIIEAVGPGVDGFRPGDRVYTSNTRTGSYAEFALCEARDVHPLPEAISFAQGAALGIPYATACRALFQRAKAIAGESVLIHGASGGVGIAALQLARKAGLKVFATAGSESGRTLIQEQGVHHVFDHHAENYLAEAIAATENGGFDVIIEMLANVNLGRDLTALKKGGRVVVVGSRGSVEINPRDVMARDAAILGMVLFNANPTETKEIFERLDQGLRDGSLNPIINKTLPLADAAGAHRLVMQPGACGKIVLCP